MFELAGEGAYLPRRNMSTPHIEVYRIVIIAGRVTGQYETPAHVFAIPPRPGRVWTVVPSSASGEIGRRARFRFWCPRTWGFKSPLAHRLTSDLTHLRAVVFERTRTHGGCRYAATVNAWSCPISPISSGCSKTSRHDGFMISSGPSDCIRSGSPERLRPCCSRSTLWQARHIWRGIYQPLRRRTGTYLPGPSSPVESVECRPRPIRLRRSAALVFR